MTRRQSLWGRSAVGKMLFAACVAVAAFAADTPPVPQASPPVAATVPASKGVGEPALLALRRTVFSASESIALRPTAWNAADPAAGELAVQLASTDGSRLRVLFQPLNRPLQPDQKLSPDGPTLSPWLLRPGTYTLAAAAGGKSESATIEVHPAIRRSSFAVIDAGFDGSALNLSPRGQDGLGFNLLFPAADRPGVPAAWTAATEPLLASAPPGGVAAAGLWTPAITDPLRLAREQFDGTAELSSAGWMFPAFQSAVGRARDRTRPPVCLPVSSPRDPAAWQLERNLSFMLGPSAVACAPLSASAEPPSPALLETVTASNRLAQRLGTIFATLPPTRPPVALLVSALPDARDDQRALLAWVAAQTLHCPVDVVTPDDVLDGVVSRHHKSVFVVSGGAIDRRTSGVLSRFAQAGGQVLLPDDAIADLPGAVKFGVAIDLSHFAAIDKLVADGKPQDAARLRRPAQLLRVAEPVAKALRARLDEAGIRSPATSDAPTVFLSRHGYGDVEYFFAVNATPDDAVGVGALAAKSATATVSLPAGGAIYDAVSSQPAADFKADGSRLAASLRFGAGQMRVFARTARPIGGVELSSPQVVSEYDKPVPLRLEIGGAVVDADRRLLSGSIPLRVRVIDALGVVRYELWRAADRGVLRLDLPLAANDPGGQWTVSVQELLSLTSADAKFEFRPPAQIGVIGGIAVTGDAAERRERPSVTSVTPAGRATLPPEATTLWRASMPDRVVSLQLSQKRLTVFSHDGSATQVDPAGKVLSRDAAPVIASPRPPEPLPAAVAANILKDRAVKRSATEAGLTAVAYWGGTVQIFGPDGRPRSQQVMASGVADLLWLDGQLIVGLSDGEVVAVKARE